MQTVAARHVLVIGSIALSAAALVACNGSNANAPAGTPPGGDVAPPSGGAPPPEGALYAEQFRPQYHFSPPYGWMNDPNGLVFSQGTYHLFYQYNPFSTDFGSIGWGHAVASDLLGWQPWPVAIPAEPDRMIFSGSAVIDERNTSGLCAPRPNPDDPECLIAVYTSHRTRPGAPVNQTQDLAFSTDGGRSWKQFDANPVLDLNRADFRDPKVIWHEPTNRWVMVLARPIERQVAIYGSSDLRRWDLLSEFGPAGATGGAWECPDLFSLPVDGDPNRVKWVMKVDLNPGHVAGGSGGQYFIGDFDGSRFTPDSASPAELWVDYGKDFYCATRWFARPGELPQETWIGWLNDWLYASDTPTFPWRGTMTLPRTLQLRAFPEGIRLVQRPIEQVASLREAPQRIETIDLADLNARLARVSAGADPFELHIVLRPAPESRFGMRLLTRGEERASTARSAAVVGYDARAQELFVERPAEGNVRVNDAFPDVHTAPLPLEDGEVTLRVFVDRNSIEVFGDEGRRVITDLIFPIEGLDALEFFADAPARSLVVEYWRLRTVW